MMTEAQIKTVRVLYANGLDWRQIQRWYKGVMSLKITKKEIEAALKDEPTERNADWDGENW